MQQKFKFVGLAIIIPQGIKNMDYLIADHNLIKKEEENLYSEKVLFLPKIWNAMTLPAERLPEINYSAKKDI